MPFDILRRLLTPFSNPVATSRYPLDGPWLGPTTRGLPEADLDVCGARETCGLGCATACPTRATNASTIAST